jgi:hypothetical protein
MENAKLQLFSAALKMMLKENALTVLRVINLFYSDFILKDGKCA